MSERCPRCGQGSRTVGHEVAKVYDGVLYWSCLACLTAWPRFTEGHSWLTAASSQYAARHNDRRQATP